MKKAAALIKKNAFRYEQFRKNIAIIKQLINFSCSVIKNLNRSYFQMAKQSN